MKKCGEILRYNKQRVSKENKIKEKHMKQWENKKTNHDFEFIGRLIELLSVLKNKTDEKTTMTQEQILEEMKNNGCDCSERTLRDYLKKIMLKLNPEDEDGYVEEGTSADDYTIVVKGLEDKLKTSSSKKLQLKQIRYNHIFSFQELNQLIESVLFMENMSDETKKRIIHKLQKLSSENFKKYSPYLSTYSGKLVENIVGGYKNSRMDEAMVEKNLKEIREAIEYNNGRGCKISFHFYGYDKDSKLIPRCYDNGTQITYVVNPYYVVLYHNKYYLICSKEPYNNVSIYRIDLMKHIQKKISTQKNGIVELRTFPSKIEGLPQEWNGEVASKFLSQHLYMFYGNPISITIKLNRERYTLLHDNFGENYQFRKHIDDTWDEVVVKCVPDAMVTWAMQCCDYVEVLKPLEVRDAVKEKCQNLLKRYEKE